MVRPYSVVAMLFAAVFFIVHLACNTPEEVSETAQNRVLVPEIDGDWWQVAGNPDLGEFNSDEQEPTAFGMWPVSYTHLTLPTKA